jgi:hypothetical protein
LSFGGNLEAIGYERLVKQCFHTLVF